MAAGGERRSRWATIAFFCVLAVCWPRRVFAQAQGDAGVPTDRAVQAERAFGEGMEAWRRGDCHGAMDGFGRAMQLVPHPHTRYNLARAEDCAGEVVRAIASYEAFLAEATDDSDRTEVRGMLARLRAQPVEIFLSSEPMGAALRVDGAETVAMRTPGRLLLAPGAHVLVFARAGSQSLVRRVVVEPGVRQDVAVTLEAVAAPPIVTPQLPPDRVFTRRIGRMFSGRVGLITGFAVPRDRPVFVVGAEAGLFFRRSLAAQFHTMWIDTDGGPVVIGADLGWVFPLEEIDLGVFVTGAALLSCDTSCRDDTFRRDSEQFVGGFAVRADVVLLPRLALGLFGRASWRNFDLSNSEGLLASGGLSLSLFL